MSSIRNVAVLGSTGSIGRATLDVLGRLSQTHRVAAISCHSQLDLFEEQIRSTRPRDAIVTDYQSASAQDWYNRNTASAHNSNSSARLSTECNTPSHAATQRWLGCERIAEIISQPDIDTVVSAIVGVAGLESAIGTVKAGKRLALANKESLVVAGSIIMSLAESTGAEVLPVDSEHSAIFQCLNSRAPSADLKRVILTASGGPLRDWPIEKLEEATVEQALVHPTWQMGRKITVDSATMMNKALEVIEAKWLFNLTADQIEVVIHPESVIHSMVEYRDASVIAQMSPPDMRLPIQYALTYPERAAAASPAMDWTQACQLNWRPVDPERYPCLQLGFEVVERGGTTGAVLNAANEACVELFLAKKIRLTEIAKICKSVLHHHNYSPAPDLSELLDLDRWSRNEVQRWIPR